MSKHTSTIVGLLTCQNEPYLKAFTTKVIGCQEVPKTKKTPLKYEVELEDTILFPEGGGQPADMGALNFEEKSVPVNYVKRDGLLAKHECDHPIPAGTTVNVDLEWARRFDHMQQHTGQHLLSAIFDTRKLETLAWSMGEKFCYVELPKRVTKEEMDAVQDEVNKVILQDLPITTTIITNEEEKAKADPSVVEKIPADYDVNNGVIRVVNIGDIDHNPCCGTHLKSTREIGSIALLHTQAMRGTNCRVFFVCGDRVHKYTTEAHRTIKMVNSQLSCLTEDIENKLVTLNQNLKDTSSREKMWMTEVATFTAHKAKEDLKSKNVVFVYKPEATLEFLNVIAKEIGELGEGKTAILACGQGAAGGAIMIVGDKLDEVATKVKDIVGNVKGGGKGRWQGKVTKWDMGAAEALETYALSL